MRRNMKRLLLIAVVIAAALGAAAYCGAHDYRAGIRELNAPDAAHPPRLLRYRIYLFGILPVGEAVISDKGEERFQGRYLRRLHASARCAGFIARLCRMTADADSYVEPASWNPVVFSQKFAFAGKEQVKDIRYDQKSGTMVINGERRVIPPGTKDPLSAVFSLRAMDFSALRQVEFFINTNQKTYLLKGEAHLRRQRILGQPHALVFVKAGIRRKDGNPYHRSSISMVLDAHNNNTPVFITAAAGGIVVCARLIDAA